MDNETATELKIESLSARKHLGQKRVTGETNQPGSPQNRTTRRRREKETCGEGWAHAWMEPESRHPTPPGSAVCKLEPGKVMMWLESKLEDLTPRDVQAGGQRSACPSSSRQQIHPSSTSHSVQAPPWTGRAPPAPLGRAIFTH